jgi:hypothetical protein
VKDKIMKPMGKNSTRFIKYHEINVNETDLLYDAMGLNSDFHDVFEILDQIKITPGKNLNSRLMKCIRNEY